MSDLTPDDPSPAPPAIPRALAARILLAVVVVAIGAALFAAAFRSSLSLVYRGVFARRDLVEIFRSLPWALRLAVPAGGGVLVGLLGIVADRRAGGAGVGDVMEAVVLGDRKLSLVRTSWKALGSWVALATGGSVGREGALIHFGASLGATAARVARLPDAAGRSVIAAGVAAGFGAAYNTPLAAILFVLEVVTGIVVLEALWPVMLATVIATAVTRALVGGGPIYGERAFAIDSSWELVAHAALGVVAGLGCVAFMRVLGAGERGFAASPIPQPWRAALGGALVGALALGIPDVVGNGYEPLNRLLDGGLPLTVLVVLVVAKAASTTASVGSGSPGGVFTPSLLMGGAGGLLWGHAMTHLGVSTSPGSYALVGMAAASAGMTHAPVMAAVLVFELSGDYAIVLPLVLATACSAAVSRSLSPSIYTAELLRRGVAWTHTLERRRP
ncbi:MAG TPA: chloride channel protein [Labilithrix sp.]|nr:chloride channel protein [Labilithrix sp.]